MIAGGADRCRQENVVTPNDRTGVAQARDISRSSGRSRRFGHSIWSAGTAHRRCHSPWVRETTGQFLGDWTMASGSSLPRHPFLIPISRLQVACNASCLLAVLNLQCGCPIIGSVKCDRRTDATNGLEPVTVNRFDDVDQPPVAAHFQSRATDFI